MYVDLSIFMLCMSFNLVLILAVQMQSRALTAEVERLKARLESLKNEDQTERSKTESIPG